jgi:putative DNA primase/helicase
MLLDEDFAKGSLLPDGFIKKVSEAKTITANPKGKDEFDFICRSLPIVVSNHWPPTRDASDAFRERALVFDFTRGIPEADRDDERARVMLEDELPGILRRFVRGFRRLRRRGDWRYPDDCVDAREIWEGHTDSVKQWADEMVTQVEGGWLPRADTYGNYTHWHRENIPGGRALGKQEFLERLSSTLGHPTKKVGAFGWKGWGITTTEFND